jgi:hypothetical protein
MRHVLAALDALAAAVAPLEKEVPDARLPRVLPTTAYLIAEKAAAPSTLAEGFSRIVRFEFIPLLGEAKTAGLLEKARTIGPFVGDSAPTDISAMNGKREIPPSVEDWNRRLGLRDLAATLVAAVEERAGDVAAIGALTTSMVAEPDVGARATALREAIDVVSRWVAAHRAASTFGGSDEMLALMLALYRTEGDLAMPRSQRSLEALVPAHPETQLQASMARGQGFLTQFGYNSLILRADRTDTDQELAGHAVGQWLLHVGGHDLLLSSQTQLAESAALWTKARHGSPMTRSGLESRLVALMDDMVVSRAGPQSGRLTLAPASADLEIRVTPAHPLAIVRFALELAYVRFDHLSRVDTMISGAPSGLHWSGDATYLLYNNQTQMDQRGVPTPNLAVFASAAGAIARSPTYVAPSGPPLRAPFLELRAALRTDGFGDPLIDPRGRSTAAVLKRNGEFLKKWLTTGSPAELARRAELLSLFVSRAGIGQWTSYPEHRANASRFRLLHSYYTQVLG